MSPTLPPQPMARRLPVVRRQSPSQVAQENDPLSFVWYFSEQAAGALPRCNPIEFAFQQSPSADNPAVPPITFFGTPAGGRPVVLPAASDLNDTFTWTPNFPVNTQFLISFTDSQGWSGGTGPLYTQTQGGDCPPNNGPTPLNFTLNTLTPQTCTQLTATVDGGKPPYTMTVYKNADRAVNITSSDNTLSWTNTITAGGALVLSISDSVGNLANTSSVLYSLGGYNLSCLVAAPPSSSASHQKPGNFGGGGTSIGAYIGAALGGAAAVLIVLGLFFYWKRKRRPLSRDRRRSSHAETDLPSLANIRPARIPSVSSTEKLPNTHSAGSTSSPSETPVDDRQMPFRPRGETATAGTFGAAGTATATDDSFRDGGPDYYTAVTSRAGTRNATGTLRSPTSAPSSAADNGTNAFSVRQHEDAGRAVTQPGPSDVIDLPPQYGAFSGSAERALAADLASIRPKGHTGP